MQRVLNRYMGVEVHRLVKIATLECLLHCHNPLISQCDVDFILVDCIVKIWSQTSNNFVRPVHQGILCDLAASDHKWDPRFVQEDRVDFIDHCYRQSSMHLCGRI